MFLWCCKNTSAQDFGITPGTSWLSCCARNPLFLAVFVQWSETLFLQCYSSTCKQHPQGCLLFWEVRGWDHWTWECEEQQGMGPCFWHISEHQRVTSSQSDCYRASCHICCFSKSNCVSFFRDDLVSTVFYRDWVRAPHLFPGPARGERVVRSCSEHGLAVCLNPLHLSWYGSLLPQLWSLHLCL